MIILTRICQEIDYEKINFSQNTGFIMQSLQARLKKVAVDVVNNDNITITHYSNFHVLNARKKGGDCILSLGLLWCRGFVWTKILNLLTVKA